MAMGRRNTTRYNSATGQEELDNLGLVHLNGRIYDPFVGRFLSADPEIQDPTHTQSYNRYSYVWNNPTNDTDPTGFATKAEVDAAVASGQFTFSGNGKLVDVTLTGFDAAGNQVPLTASSFGNFTNAVEIYAVHGSSISISMLSPAALAAKTSSDSRFGPSAGSSEDRWGNAKSRPDTPLGLKKFKNKYSLMDVLESKIWSDSLPNTPSAHEQGLLAFADANGENPIFVVEHYKAAYVANTKQYSHIPMPDYDTMFADLSAKYDIPRSDSLFVEEHTHPFPTVRRPFMPYLERGPSQGPNSDETFVKMKGYRDAYHVVQGMDPTGAREFFNYGERAMSDF